MKRADWCHGMSFRCERQRNPFCFFWGKEKWKKNRRAALTPKSESSCDGSPPPLIAKKSQANNSHFFSLSAEWNEDPKLIYRLEREHRETPRSLTQVMQDRNHATRVRPIQTAVARATVEAQTFKELRCQNSDKTLTLGICKSPNTGANFVLCYIQKLYFLNLCSQFNLILSIFIL